jgi:hypothetical protein
MLTDEKKVQLKALLGGNEELLSELLDNVAITDKAAQAAGTTYKDDAPPAWAQALVSRIEAIEVSLKSAATTTDEPAEVETKDDGVGDMEAMADEGGMGAETMDMEPEGDENMLTEGEIGAIANAVVAAITPLLDIEKKMAGHLNDMKGLIGGMATTKDAAIAEVKADLETVKGQVADLNGSQPRILSGGFRASQSKTTITDDAKLKEAVPQADPVAQSFTSWLTDMGIGGQPQA